MGESESERSLGIAVLDFGYFKLTLKPRWMARADLARSSIQLASLTGSAWAELSIVNAGNQHQAEILNRLYVSIERASLLQGRHVDDVSEDLDHELIVEYVSAKSDYVAEHYFLRLCGDVIIVARLSEHTPQEEDELRGMLDTLVPGEIQASGEPLTRLEFEADFDAWDKLGETAVFLGGE